MDHWRLGGLKTRQQLKTAGTSLQRASRKLGKEDRKFWTKVGVAFVNRDGSLNCKLDSLPVGGELHIRDFVPREERALNSARLSGPQALAS